MILKLLELFKLQILKTHSFTIEINMKHYLANTSIFDPFMPLVIDKQLFGFAYDENAVVKDKPEKGAWGVIILEKRKEEGKREGKVHFLDGKEVPVQLEVQEGSITLKVGGNDLMFLDCTGF